MNDLFGKLYNIYTGVLEQPPNDVLNFVLKGKSDAELEQLYNEVMTNPDVAAQVRAAGLDTAYNVSDNLNENILDSGTSYANATQASQATNPVDYATNGTASVAGPAATRGVMSKVKNWWTGNDPLIGKGMSFNVGNVAKQLGSRKLIGNLDVNGASSIGQGIYQGANLVKNLNNASNSDTDLDNMYRDLKSMAYANPLYASYLSPAQKRMMRQVQNGSFGGNALGAGLGQVVKDLPKTALGVGANLLMGNVPGAVIAGAGGIGNSMASGYTNSQRNKADMLQGLYDNLSEAQNEYNLSKRPGNLRSAGLSRRSYNSLY